MFDSFLNFTTRGPTPENILDLSFKNWKKLEYIKIRQEQQNMLGAKQLF
jgi:hypothetical protein